MVAASAFAGTLDTSRFHRMLSFTASGYDGASTLTNFPVLVRLSEESVAGFRYAEFGGETNHVYAALRFADATGRNLDYEIDFWNTNGQSAIWVSLPVLSGKATKFKAYWLAVPTYTLPAVHPTNVWTSAGYVGVWHLTQRIGNYALTAYYPDSTGRGSHILNPTKDEKWLAPNATNDVAFNANGTPWYPGGARGNAINTGDWNFSQTGYSVETWLTTGLYADRNAYMFADASTTNYGAEAQWTPANGMQIFRRYAALMGGTVKNTVVVQYPWEGEATNDWHYISAVWTPAGSGDLTMLYEAGIGFEGEIRVLRTSTRNAIDFLGGDPRFVGGMGILGSVDAGGGTLHRVDEPRVRRGMSSTDWIQASWDTQRNGTDFLEVGDVRSRVIGLSVSLR